MTDVITPAGDQNYATASTSATDDDHTLEINGPAADSQSMAGDDISMPDQQDPVPNNTVSVMPSEESTQPTHISPVPCASNFVTIQSSDYATQGPFRISLGQQKNFDPNLAAPAFLKLKVPEPKQKKTVQGLRDKLPKALSGKGAIKILQERKQKKEEEEIAKAKRKEERLQKRIQMEAERERKKMEREQKQNQKKARKANQKRKTKEVKRDSVRSDSDIENVPYMDEDSDNFEEEFDMCPGCSRGDQHPSRWVKCGECSTRWHFICADRPDFEHLDESERKRVEFVCPLCN